ncbi:MAG: DNA polymerase III subunit delta [Planctomycetaceae bacterium]|nr:DNA polymerase III subunit delta [Planctomycetaceae bacterium]
MAARSDAPSSPSADMRVVVLHGKDAFLRLERGRQLESSLQERFGGVDRMDLDGTNAALADVLDNLRTPGLFAGHKLVVLENAEAFMGAEDRRRAMERYAENPCAEATLLMRCASGWRPGNFDKLVAKVGAVIKCDSPTPMEAVKWCAARSLRRHQAEMEPAAAELLVEKLGPDLGRLDAELGKLAAAAARPGAGTTKVTRAIVQEFTGLSREEQAWEIQGPVLEGKADAALVKLDELLRVSRVPEVMIGWSLVDLARKVHDASCLLSQGESEGAVAKALKLWGPASSSVVRAGRRIKPAAAARLFRMAVETDRATKNGTAPEPARAFEGLMVQLAEALA